MVDGTSVLARPAGAAHRPHRVQGRLAGDLAEALGARGHRRGAARRRPTPACYDLLDLGARIDAALRRHARPRGGRGGVRSGPAGGRVPPRRPAARARRYADPLATFATNVMGTAHVLEALRAQPRRRRGVVVTTDKVLRAARAPPHRSPRTTRSAATSPTPPARPRPSWSAASLPALVLRRRRGSSRPRAAATSSAAATGRPTGSSPTSSRAARERQPAACCATRTRPGPGSTCSTPWPATWSSPSAACAATAPSRGPQLRPGRRALGERGRARRRAAARAGQRRAGADRRGARAARGGHARPRRLDAGRPLGWSAALDAAAAVAATLDWYRGLAGGADARALTLRADRALAEAPHDRAACRACAAAARRDRGRPRRAAAGQQLCAPSG